MVDNQTPIPNNGGNATNDTEAPMTGKRYAVLAGSNFLGTENQLAGCINDLIDVRKMIEGTGITILADLRDAQMTTANWKAALMNAAAIAQPGDVIFHMHSHHGATLPDANEPNGVEEIWCPNDFDWSPEHMIDEEWLSHTLLASMKTGVRWVDWADCCHAGNSFRGLWCPGEKPRFIPNPDLKDFDAKKVSPIVVSHQNVKGILLAGCRCDQTSADAYINGEHCGAFSHSMEQAIAGNPAGTYQDIMLKATQLLGLGGYDQKPELDCAAGDENGVFSHDILGK